MENLMYWVAGFFTAYLVVRGIKSIWAGGLVFLCLLPIDTSAQTVYLRVWNQHTSGSSIAVDYQRQHGGTDFEVAIQGTGTLANGGLSSFISFSAGGDLTDNFRYRVSSVGGVATGETEWRLFSATSTDMAGADALLEITETAASIPTTFTNYFSVECWTNNLGVSADVTVDAYQRYDLVDFPNMQGTQEVLVSRITPSSAGVPESGGSGGAWRVPPGGTVCFTNDSLVPIDFFFSGPGTHQTDWQGTTETNLTDQTPTIYTNTPPANGTNISYNGGAPTSATNPDPFANIPQRNPASTNRDVNARQDAEGIVKAISDGGSLTGGKLDLIYGALTNGFGGSSGGSTDGDGDGLNDVQEDLLRVIATNTTTLSNMLYQATNLAGIQGLAAAAFTEAQSIYSSSTGSMGQAMLVVSNVDWTLTNSLNPAERSESSLLSVHIGTLAGKDYVINFDPNQDSTLLADFFDVLRFTKAWWSLFIGLGLFWVMFREVMEYQKITVLNVAQVAKMPTAGVANLAARATFGTFLVATITTFVGMLPFTALGVVSLFSGVSAMPETLDVGTSVENSGLSNPIIETMLKYFWAFLQLVPLRELVTAFLQWAVFQFYMPWLFGLITTILGAFNIMVLGRCILPFLFLASSAAAQLELHNLTGTNLVWTNASRILEFPPGETRIDIEPGWNFAEDGTEVDLPLTEDLQVMRVSRDPGGGIEVDIGFATSAADFFWYGFAAGLSLFGLLAAVSAVKSGLGAGRNNVWVGD